MDQVDFHWDHKCCLWEKRSFSFAQSINMINIRFHKIICTCDYPIWLLCLASLSKNRDQTRTLCQPMSDWPTNLFVLNLEDFLVNTQRNTITIMHSSGLRLITLVISAQIGKPFRRKPNKFKSSLAIGKQILAFKSLHKILLAYTYQK